MQATKFGYKKRRIREVKKIKGNNRKISTILKLI